MTKKNVFIMSSFAVAIFTLSACQKPIDSAQVTEVNADDSVQVVEEQGGEMKVEGRYELQVEKSTLGWSAGKIVGDDYTGKVPLISGYLAAEAGVFTEGEFVIDMTGMSHDDDKQAVIDHLKSEDFFNVEKYPTSTFKLLSVEQIEGQYEIKGDLTIMDQTQPIEFMAQMEQMENGIKASAQFKIDRTRWGIKYGSANFFDDLGDKAIKNEIGYSLELYFQ